METDPPPVRGWSEPSEDLEDREVRVEDPQLSDAANAALTADLQEVLQTDRVRVRRDQRHPSRGDSPHAASAGVFVTENRMVLGITFWALVVVAAIVSLVSGSWYFLPLAAGVHALATMLVMVGSMRRATSRERPRATTVALVEDEGIRDAEALFTDLVTEFSHGEDGEARDLMAPEAGHRRTSNRHDPVTSGAEQRTAMTPTAEPSEAVDEGSLPFALGALLLGGLLVIAFAIAIAIGGWMWLVPAIISPTVAGGWLLHRIAGEVDEPRLERWRRRHGSTAIMAGTVVAVIVFCALVAVWMTVRAT